MIVFYISGEQQELAIAELRALYETYNIEFKILAQDNRLLLMENDIDPQILTRLSFTHEFHIVKELTDMNNLNEVLLGQGLKKDETFCVRCKGFANNALSERELGSVIYDAQKIPVDLKAPKVTLQLIKINDVVAICYDKYEPEDSTSVRNPNDRPYFHPLALNPKLAKLFLNLARLKEGDSVLDPFCGSGSVLIEAALMGFDAIGSDMDRGMLWGSGKNLKFYGLKAKTAEADATEIELTNLDAIVTDPPYARASKMFSKELETLYDEFLASAYTALKPGGFLVMAVPEEARVGYAIVGFELAGNYNLYVHRSLTRRIYILKKPN